MAEHPEALSNAELAKLQLSPAWPNLISGETAKRLLATIDARDKTIAELEIRRDKFRDEFAAECQNNKDLRAELAALKAERDAVQKEVTELREIISGPSVADQQAMAGD